MTVYRIEPTDKPWWMLAKPTFGSTSNLKRLRWYEGLLKAFRSLEKNPLRCPIAPESAFFEEEIRQLIYGKYRVLFTVEGERVLVLRVRHGAQEYLKPEEE